MNSELRDKTVLIVDSGWYCELGPRLAHEFGTVLYWSPWNSSWPYSQDAAIGYGLEGVTRVDSIEDASLEADLVVFPSDGYAPVRESMERQGIPTWGSGRAEILEQDRVLLKEILAAAGQPTIPHVVVSGVNDLRAYLESHDDVYVKLAHQKYRGDTETFHHENWEKSEQRWLGLAHRLGPLGRGISFIIEEPTPGFEGGCDWICVNGQFANVGMIGYEIKDSCYISTLKPWGQLSPFIRDGLIALQRDLTRMEYRNLVSTEVRITDDNTPYLIDLAARFPWPPSGSIMYNCRNLGEIMYYAATNGTLVQPDWRFKYTVELNLSSPWLIDNWLAVELVDYLRPHVMLHNATYIDGVYWLRPQKRELNSEIAYIGTIVAAGDDLDAAILRASEVAKDVAKDGIEADLGDITKAQDEIKKGEEHGIQW